MAGVPLPIDRPRRATNGRSRHKCSGATFQGKRSEDATTFPSVWRPNPGGKGPENVAYDIGAAEPWYSHMEGLDMHIKLACS